MGKEGCAMGEVVLCTVSCVVKLCVCLWIFAFGLSLMVGVKKEFFRVHLLMFELTTSSIRRHKVFVTAAVVALLTSVVIAGLIKG